MRNDLSHDFLISSSPFISSDNFEFESFSPLKEIVSYVKSQNSHGLSYSLPVLTFSKKQLTPFGEKSRNEPLAIVPVFECISRKKSDDFTTPPPDLIQKQENDTLCKSEMISKNDIKYMRTLIPKEEDKSGRLIVKLKEEPKKQRKAVIKKEDKVFPCRHCTMSFRRSQALGGHMSRAHPGKSFEYKKKKTKRKSREIERLKLLIAKRKYFKMINYNYDELFETIEGRKKAQALIDRTAIKKIKRDLTKQEIDNYFENKILDEIRENS